MKTAKGILAPANARFWTWFIGGWVKVTLAPGQCLGWYRYARHEEGLVIRGAYLALGWRDADRAVRH